jgi:NADPH:quinone reductase-like Zn-dependent oxidoreductase
MYTWELRQFGITGLVRAERPDPSPAPGQVLVKVHAASLNYRDLLTVMGQYNPRLKLPLVPCSDGAGEVVAVGAGVTRVKPGDRVCGLFAQGWIAGEVTRAKASTTLGGPLDGMLTEYAVLSAEGVVPVPDHLSYAEAACLPCAAVTAWSAVVEQGRVKAGDVVLVQGTGGVSIFALQFAKLLGARVIVTSSSDEKLARAQALGADALINYRSTPDWDKAARELTGGLGVDHVVEVGGAGTFQRSLRAVRMAGTISVIGVLGGASGDISVIPVLMQNLRLQGVIVGNRESFEAMNRAISLHQLRPVVDQEFAFGEAPAAFARIAAGAHLGKIVVAGA